MMVLVVISNHSARLHSDVGSVSDCRTKGHKIESQFNHITLVEIDREIISVGILPFPLIQKGHLSVTSESMYTRTG